MLSRAKELTSRLHNAVLCALTALRQRLADTPKPIGCLPGIACRGTFHVPSLPLPPVSTGFTRADVVSGPRYRSEHGGQSSTLIASSLLSPQLDRRPSGWPSVGAATLKTDTGSSSVGNMAAARAPTPHKVSSRAGGRSKIGTCWNCSLDPCAGRMTSRFQANAQGQWCTQDCAPSAEGDGKSASLEHFACHARCWPIDNGRTKQSLRLSRRELGASASKRGWHQAASRSKCTSMLRKAHAHNSTLLLILVSIHTSTHTQPRFVLSKCDGESPWTLEGATARVLPRRPPCSFVPVPALLVSVSGAGSGLHICSNR